MKDKKVENLIKKEKQRQGKVVNLIASENKVSDDVLKALGSDLTNKYSEGYPGKRYYGGNPVIDEIETLCQERALDLFNLSPKTWSVNVQPLSGSVANLAVYTALVPKGGKIMGMSLDSGGHLTHGHWVSASGTFWKQVPYGVDEKSGLLDYDNLKKIAKAKKPHIIVVGYTAYSRKIDWKKFREIADSCGAILMADISHLAGLIAGKAYPTPFKYADVVTSTTHKTLRGPRSAMIFSKGDISEKIDKAVFPGLQGGPHQNQIAAVAVALKEAGSKSFEKYAKQVVLNAKTLAKELSKRGWKIISGGTDSHLMLVDVAEAGLTGKEAEARLEKAGIIVNKNMIPGDKRSAFDPSGIRIGAAWETSCGSKEKDFVEIAGRIDEILRG